MYELVRHIEVLLLHHNCVIVPDFGGFMSHYTSARYDEDTDMMLPPMRTVGFNSQLNVNDSVLAQSYVDAYDISYPEALRMIGDAVNELNMYLIENGCYDIASIGRISINSDGKYEFEPCPAGILSPSLYALCSVEITRRNKLSGTIEVKKQTKTPKFLITKNNINNDKTNDESVKFPDDVISTTALRNVFVAAACVIAFIFIAIPWGMKTGRIGRIDLSSIDTGLFMKYLPSVETTGKPDLNVGGTQHKIVEKHRTVVVKNITKIKVDNTKAINNVEPCIKVETKLNYTVVLASRVTKANAETFVNQLHNRGIKDAEVVTHGSVTRVICGHFPTEEEAKKYCNILKDQYEDLNQSWVLNTNK